MNSRTQILEVLNEYIHNKKDREIMTVYLTDHPGSLERIAEECDVAKSTVQRVINRCSYIYKYLPEPENKKG